MLAVYKKELRSFFINPVGFVFTGIFLTLELNGLITLTSRAAQEHVAVAHILEHNGTIILWMKSFFHICMFCICYVYIFVYTVVTICAMVAFFRFSVQNYVFFPYLPNLLAGKVINISILPCFYGILVPPKSPIIMRPETSFCLSGTAFRARAKMREKGLLLP